MASAIWPPIGPAQLDFEEDTTLTNELQWLLEALQDTLQSLKAGLEECAALLAPTEPGSTLALSSHRSESLKGFITRVGTRIVKGDVKLRLSTLPPPKGQLSYPVALSSAPHASTWVLQQLTAARTHVNACLDVVDVSTWAGNADDPRFILGQMRLLDVNICEAKSALKGGSDFLLDPWWSYRLDDSTFEPPLPPNLSVHLYIIDAALVLEVRTLEPSSHTISEFHSPFNFRDRLAMALGASKVQPHDEMDERFAYDGREVLVKEKIRVESQDPNLMAAMAKLNALERSITLGKQALDVVLGAED